MPISSGSYTVGPAGDYTTWYAAVTDIASTLTGNLTLTQNGNTTETSRINRGFGNEIDLNGFNLTLDNSTPHAGIVGAGNISTLNIGTHTIEVLGTSGTFEVKNLQFKNGTNTDNQALLLQADGNDFVTCIYHDLIFDGNLAPIPFEFLINHQYSNVCTVYNILHVDATSSLSFGCVRFDNNNDFLAQKFYNVTVKALGSGYGIWLADFPSGSHELKNLVSMTESGIAFGYAGTNAASIPANFMSSCASDDSSAAGGTNAITGFTPSTEFSSTTKGETDYLVPRYNSQFKQAGASVATTTDMKGTSYGSSPPIGAFVAEGVISDINSARDVLADSWRASTVAGVAGVAAATWASTTPSIGHVFTLPSPGAINRGRLPIVQLIFQGQERQFLTDDGGMTTISYVARVIVGGVSGYDNQVVAEAILQAGLEATRNGTNTTSDYWRVSITDSTTEHQTGPMYHILEIAITAELSWEREH